MFKKTIGFVSVSMLLLLIWAQAAPAADRIILKNVIGKKGTEGGAINDLYDIYLDKKGNLYLVDGDNHKVIKYDPSGKFLMEFGKFGSDPGKLYYPERIAVDPEGNIFVEDEHDHSLISDSRADTRNYHRVQKFSPNGDFLWSVGGYGKGNGEFGGSLTDIETDKEGNLYVLDRYNYRVQKFSPGGKFLLAFGRYGRSNGEFDSPAMLLVDDNFNIYVSDPGNLRIQKFDRKGKFLLAFGKEGSNDGEFKSPYPSYMYFDKNNNLCAITSYSFYTSNKRRYIKCLVQKFDLNGEFRGKLYGIERYYDGDDSYSLNYFLSDAEDNLYLFHSRDKTINLYSFGRAAINWGAMSKYYDLKISKPTEASNSTTISTTSTSESLRSLSGWEPEQTITLYYEMDDLTNVTLSNYTSLTSMGGPRDSRSNYSGTLTWTSWEATENRLYNNISVTVSRLFDKTKNKAVNYSLGYTYEDRTERWGVKAPEVSLPSHYTSLNASANVDISDFSDIEVGYYKRTSQSTNDYRNLYDYISTSDSPSDHVYLRYHADF